MSANRPYIAPPPGGQSSQEGVASPISRTDLPEPTTEVVSTPVGDWQGGVAGPPIAPQKAAARRARRAERWHRKHLVPQPGGEALHEGEAGPLVYSHPMPPVKTRLRYVRGRGLVIVDPAPQEQTEQPVPPKTPARPLIPASEEVAKLPRPAREAFAARCAARVAKLRSGATTPEAVAALLLAAATVETPLRRQLLCVRRDFDRLARRAQEQSWTDDTPVPPDTFGPMWPTNLTPDWAKEPPAQ